jgi:hypothetical protein
VHDGPSNGNNAEIDVHKSGLNLLKILVFGYLNNSFGAASLRLL